MTLSHYSEQPASWADDWLTPGERKSLRTLEQAADAQRAQYAAQDAARAMQSQHATSFEQSVKRADDYASRHPWIVLLGLVFGGLSIPLIWGALTVLLAP